MSAREITTIHSFSSERAILAITRSSVTPACLPGGEVTPHKGTLLLLDVHLKIVFDGQTTIRARVIRSLSRDDPRQNLLGGKEFSSFWLFSSK